MWPNIQIMENNWPPEQKTTSIFPALSRWSSQALQSRSFFSNYIHTSFFLLCHYLLSLLVNSSSLFPAVILVCSSISLLLSLPLYLLVQLLCFCDFLFPEFWPSVKWLPMKCSFTSSSFWHCLGLAMYCQDGWRALALCCLLQCSCQCRTISCF